MKYVYVAQNKVQEIVSDFAEPFYDLPAKRRYPADFLNQCFIFPDDFDVQLSYDYVQATKEFKQPVTEIEPETIEVGVGEEKEISLGFELAENFTVDSNLMFSVEGSKMTITPKDAGKHTISILLNSENDHVIDKIILVNAKGAGK